ncbi:hypothetical protein [Sodalis sp. dw_96]|uniref:hypothetical protein n=1 Tax=Sodalis sp. dw_96 TaxID=2719794 RepID=UPI001BD2E1DA|nr:hypothetical protein [Sodalis sp. dw_96]
MIKCYIFMLLFIPYVSFANVFCENLNRNVEREQYYINSNESGYKVGSIGRAYFYSAPSEECKIKSLFIVHGDQVDVLAEYNGYSSIIYFKKDENPILGWIKTEALISAGTGIGPKKCKSIPLIH